MSILETIKPKKGSVKKKVRKGRGNASGFGGEAGRGHKGQKSRSGGGTRPGFEGGQMPLYMRLPKKPGMKNHVGTEYDVINLGIIDKCFEDGETVDLVSLRERGFKPRYQLLKVLGKGTLSKKVLIKAHKVSQSVFKQVEATGSTLEIISETHG